MGARGSRSSANRGTSSPRPTGRPSPSPAQPASSPTRRSGAMPRSRSSARLGVPARLASRFPSAPSSNGTCAYVGTRQPERLAELDLPRCRAEQVVAAEDVGDAGVRVVHHHRELVAGDAVVAEHHEVADLASDVLDEGAVEEVVNLGQALVRSEAPGGRTGAGPVGALLGSEREAGSRIPRAVVRRSVRRGGGAGDLAARAEARVHAACLPETVERGAVELPASALEHRSAVEVEAEPREICEQCVGELGSGAGRVEVLDPEVELPALGAGPEPAEHRRPGIAEVEPPRGTGGEPAAMGRRHVAVRGATAPL